MSQSDEFWKWGMQKQYIYLIQAGETEHFKIGSTTKPYDRLKGLNTGNPHKLKLRGVIEAENSRRKERELQQHFSQYQAQGEWFQFPPPVSQEVVALFSQKLPTSEECQQQDRQSSRIQNSWRITCWSEQDHHHRWSECWEQFSMYLKTPVATKTGWVEEYRFYWMTPQGAAFYGVYEFCCILSTPRGEEHGEWTIGRQGFNPSPEIDAIAIPSAAVVKTTQTKLSRVSEGILAGEAYSNTLKYLSATPLLKKTQKHCLSSA